MNNKGVFGYAYALIIAVFLCLIIFAFLSILISNMAATTFASLQPIQNATLAQAALISDANISQSMIDSVNASNNLAQTNVEIFQLLAGFSGIITIIIVGIVYFLLTQKNVEANRQGGLQ
jgi:chromate transport protein ChrA